MRQLRTKRIFVQAGFLLFAGLALLSAGCSTGFILASHEPMHQDGRPVTLKAVSTGHVDRIELRIQRFAVDPVNLMSRESTLTPAMLVWVCDPPFFVNTLACAYQLAFSGDEQIVEFHAKAVYWNGTEDDEVYRFASGDFLAAHTPIPIRMKRRPEDGIDVVIVPHTDMVPEGDAGSLRSFRTYLDDIVDGILFDYAVILDHRALYNFWYSPEGVNFVSESCYFPDPGGINVDLFSDVGIYVHYEERRDCAKNKNFSTELWYDKTMMHELGHALADLRDEYPVSTDEYGPQDEVPNIFQGRQACQEEAPLIGLPPESCQFSTPAFDLWRIDPSGAEGCLMGPSQHLTWSNFGPACIRRLNWRHGQCLRGNCFKTENPPGDAEEPSPEDNERKL